MSITEKLMVADLTETDFTIYVVDDDMSVRSATLNAISTMMSSTAVGLESAEEFLRVYSKGPAVLVTDLRMPGMTGLELQKTLTARGLFIPVVIITAYPKTQFIVESVRAGAVAILEKPFKLDDLWLALREAIGQYQTGLGQHNARLNAAERIRSLTSAEKEVLRLIMDGQKNRFMAEELAVSVRTIEARRKRIFSKMGVDSIVELVRTVHLTDFPNI